MTTTYDVLVIGAGQAGLAAGYYLRRTALRWLILDAEHSPGAAWRHSLRTIVRCKISLI